MGDYIAREFEVGQERGAAVDCGWQVDHLGLELASQLVELHAQLALVLLQAAEGAEQG